MKLFEDQNEEAEDFLTDAWEKQFSKKLPARSDRFTVITVS